MMARCLLTTSGPFVIMIPHRAPVLIAIALFALTGAEAQETHAGFVTTLGRDTVALESFRRTPARLEGDLLVRVPGTVLFHYRLDLRPDGTVSRSVVDIDPLGVSRFAAGHVTLDFGKDSVQVTVEELAQRRQSKVALDAKPVPFLMTGFESSYGLYSSLGVIELLVSQMPVSATDTMLVSSIGLANGTKVKRKLMRRTATTADVDYFLIAWTRMTTDEQGHILTVDMSQTTEKTQSTRTGFLNVRRMAEQFATRDREGQGLGVASPNESVSTNVDDATLSLRYGSPRTRGRKILGEVVSLDRVWRTGANEATVFITNRDITIGDVNVPTGTYTLYTLPTRTGVQLIINRQHGQWGTSYDSTRDLARVAMETRTTVAVQEAFTIGVAGIAGSRAELRIAWDTFVWSVPIVVK